MNEDTTDQNSNSEEKKQAQSDNLFEATRKIADKTEEFANETATKIKDSEAFNKLSETFKKVSDYMEGKSEEFNKSDFADKLEVLKEKTIRETDKYIGKIKEMSRDISEEIDEAIDSIKVKMKKGKNE